MSNNIRRSISLKRSTYEHLKVKAAEENTSASNLVETLVSKKLDELGVPTEIEAALVTTPCDPPQETTNENGVFTF